MTDLSPGWTRETIALLIGKELDNENASQEQTSSSSKESACVKVSIISPEHRPPTSDPINAWAKIEFQSVDEMKATVCCYQGLPVPMTHGYHHYSFITVGSLKLTSGQDASESVAANSNIKEEEEVSPSASMWRTDTWLRLANVPSV